jgi:hypothetical protein
MNYLPGLFSAVHIANINEHFFVASNSAGAFGPARDERFRIELTLPILCFRYYPFKLIKI